ncbi:MAG: riboflavin kinase [Patescibacteria group bacterium]|nr:riboflavin kinase [Patescibacteria group bacterium]
MFSFRAKVVKGLSRGRQLGFPTANLEIKSLPVDYGVYLARVKLGRIVKLALMHYGPKATFNEAVSCELFIKNFRKNIYGLTLEVEIVRKIRKVKKFVDVEALKKQIKRDLKELEK